MEYKLVEKMKERGKYFYQVALFDEKNNKWELALFHLEQSLQLLIKSKLLAEIGDFPKTHSLRELTKILIKILPKSKKIIKENLGCLDILEDAYIASRYLLAEYGKEELKKCKNFVKEMWKVIWNERV